MTFFTAGTETLTHTAQHLHTPSTHLHTLSHAPSTHLHTPFHAPSHTLRSWWIFSSLNNDKTKKSDAAGCRQYRYKVVKRLQMGFREKDGRGDKEVSRGNCGSCGNCTLYQFIYYFYKLSYQRKHEARAGPTAPFLSSEIVFLTS